jgi:uncharacterized membrane protein
MRLLSYEVLRRPLVISAVVLSLGAPTAGTVRHAAAAPPETGVPWHTGVEHKPAIRAAAEQGGVSAEPQEKNSEAPGLGQPSTLSRSVKKNISFRALGTFVDFAIAYFVTAATGLSTGIALTINSTDSVWFILNDQYWTDYYAKLKAGTRSQETLVGGTTVENVLPIAGKQVPLPVASWVVVADRASDWNDKRYGSFGNIKSVVLAHVVGGRVDAIIEVNTNTQPTANGWGLAFDCARSDLPYALIRYSDGWDGSCYFVNHTVLVGEPTPVWRESEAFMRDQGWSLSHVWLTAGFRSVNKTDVLDVRFHFAPETRGIGAETVDRWEESAWMSAKLNDDARRQGWVRAVEDWALSYSALLDSGLKNQLTNTANITMPQPANPAQTAARRIAMLKSLRHAASTSISPEQAEKPDQSEGEDAEDAAPDAPKLEMAPGVAEMAGVRALSYRLIVSVSHIFVNYAWTGSAVITAELEVLQIIINSAKFYVHEMAWETYFPDAPRGDLGRIVDFNYIGVNS